jgi:hypothetical protein
MTLTIIVCHMRERRQLLSRCLFYLENQTCDKADVLVMHSNRPKGDKLNFAYNHVDTTHVMVVDDDDWVSPVLVESVIDHEEDFVGYDALQMADGRFSTVIHQETASHICPVRTDLAVQIPFGNDYLDDIHWTRKVAPLVTTETYLDERLYFYDKWNQPGGGWSPPRQVGMWPYDKRNFGWG